MRDCYSFLQHNDRVLFIFKDENTAARCRINQLCVFLPPQALYISGGDVIPAEPSAYVTALVTMVESRPLGAVQRPTAGRTQILFLIIQQTP